MHKRPLTPACCLDITSSYCLYLGFNACSCSQSRVITAAAEQLDAVIQVFCPVAIAVVWSLLDSIKCYYPFEFEANSAIANWANLLGYLCEMNFQICLDFASDCDIGLILSISNIPTRVGTEGFAATIRSQIVTGAYIAQSWRDLEISHS